MAHGRVPLSLVRTIPGRILKSPSKLLGLVNHNLQQDKLELIIIASTVYSPTYDEFT